MYGIIIIIIRRRRTRHRVQNLVRLRRRFWNWVEIRLRTSIRTRPSPPARRAPGRRGTATRPRPCRRSRGASSSSGAPSVRWARPPRSLARVPSSMKILKSNKFCLLSFLFLFFRGKDQSLLYCLSSFHNGDYCMGVSWVGRQREGVSSNYSVGFFFKFEQILTKKKLKTIIKILEWCVEPRSVKRGGSYRGSSILNGDHKVSLCLSEFVFY